MARFDLTDIEWGLIRPLLPNKPRGVARADDRRVLNGIFWVLRTGSPWRDLPERYGPYTTIYNRFNRWDKAGTWFRYLKRFRKNHQTACSPSAARFIRVHQHAASGIRRARITPSVALVVD